MNLIPGSISFWFHIGSFEFGEEDNEAFRKFFKCCSGSHAGLGQFINCCLPENSTIEWVEGQNMKVKQCEFITNIDHRFRPDYKDLSPAYAKVKQHDELLLPSDYGGRQKISA